MVINSKLYIYEKLLKHHLHISVTLSLKSGGPLDPVPRIDPQVVRVQFVRCLQVTSFPDSYFRNHRTSVLVALQSVHHIVCLALSDTLQDVGGPLAHLQCRQHGARILIKQVSHQNGGDDNGEEVDLLLVLLSERTCGRKSGGEH